jgi:hypothetical protein
MPGMPLSDGQFSCVPGIPLHTHCHTSLASRRAMWAAQMVSDNVHLFTLCTCHAPFHVNSPTPRHSSLQSLHRISHTWPGIHVIFYPSKHCLSVLVGYEPEAGAMQMEGKEFSKPLHMSKKGVQPSIADIPACKAKP